MAKMSRLITIDKYFFVLPIILFHLQELGESLTSITSFALQNPCAIAKAKATHSRF